MNSINFKGLISYLFLFELKSDLGKYLLGPVWWVLEPSLIESICSHVNWLEKGVVVESGGGEFVAAAYAKSFESDPQASGRTKALIAV